MRRCHAHQLPSFVGAPQYIVLSGGVLRTQRHWPDASFLNEVAYRRPGAECRVVTLAQLIRLTTEGLILRSHTTIDGEVMLVAMKITEHWALHSDRCLNQRTG